MIALLTDWFSINLQLYVVTFMVWYFFYGIFSYYITYEQSRSGVFLPLFALLDDLSLQIPGNKVKRLIAASPHSSGGYYCFSGFDGHWTGQQLRDDYKLCVKISQRMYPGKIYCFILTFPLFFPIYLCAWKMLF